MSSSRPTHYRLTPKALDDLDAIWRYTAETWSIDQADSYIDDLMRAFDVLVAAPTTVREQAEFSPPVRIYIHQSHLVIYALESDHIVVVRILGGRQNWQTIMHAVNQ